MDDLDLGLAVPAAVHLDGDRVAGAQAVGVGVELGPAGSLRVEPQPADLRGSGVVVGVEHPHSLSGEFGDGVGDLAGVGALVAKPLGDVHELRGLLGRGHGERLDRLDIRSVRTVELGDDRDLVQGEVVALHRRGGELAARDRGGLLHSGGRDVGAAGDLAGGQPEVEQLLVRPDLVDLAGPGAVLVLLELINDPVDHLGTVIGVRVVAGSAGLDQHRDSRAAGLDRGEGAALALAHHQRALAVAADDDRFPDTTVGDRAQERAVQRDVAAHVRADDQRPRIDMQQLADRLVVAGGYVGVGRLSRVTGLGAGGGGVGSRVGSVRVVDGRRVVDSREGGDGLVGVDDEGHGWLLGGWPERGSSGSRPGAGRTRPGQRRPRRRGFRLRHSGRTGGGPGVTGSGRRCAGSLRWRRPGSSAVAAGRRCQSATPRTPGRPRRRQTIKTGITIKPTARRHHPPCSPDPVDRLLTQLHLGGNGCAGSSATPARAPGPADGRRQLVTVDSDPGRLRRARQGGPQPLGGASQPSLRPRR
ncbi:hypothetical protein HOP40_20710 [Pseudonocardia broussonetiae]|uniref:Uncharacterized protein n=1 Tax=Pseudonocardia broussonetiae TaxID=2736640 RepID=A0A6M6J998_9PSEU|nr:hypothetical protein [Pseudonocardia broussonetiae]QJY44414.1 hypothetical protein HOP40_20710 [Pseudonocardia broussonetiae]